MTSNVNNVNDDLTSGADETVESAAAAADEIINSMNLGGEAPEKPATEAKAPKAKGKQAVKQESAAPAEPVRGDTSDRVTIVLDDPGTGNVSQFFGINGKGYHIKFNEEVTVPRALLSVLDEAIVTRSIPLEEGGIIERSHKRFPYRIVRGG